MTKITVEKTDGMQVIKNDLLRQRQVSPPSSPKENEFLAGLMKSPAKPQLDQQLKQALDKDSLSLLSPTKQAEKDPADANQGHRTGDVTWRQRAFIPWIFFP